MRMRYTRNQFTAISVDLFAYSSVLQHISRFSSFIIGSFFLRFWCLYHTMTQFVEMLSSDQSGCNGGVEMLHKQKEWINSARHRQSSYAGIRRMGRDSILHKLIHMSRKVFINEKDIHKFNFHRIITAIHYYDTFTPFWAKLSNHNFSPAEWK